MILANVHVAWRVACSLAFLSQGVVAVIRGNKLGADNNKQVKHSQRGAIQGTVLIPLRTTMSSIDMLEIAGIRSFAPEPPQVYSPFDCGSCVECRLDARVTRKPLCFKLPAQILQTIKFYKPLTVIVGDNGAGKTVRCIFRCVSLWFYPLGVRRRSSSR
jgi:hypothetical protein